MRTSSLYGKYLAERHNSVASAPSLNELYVKIEKGSDPAQPLETNDETRQRRLEAIAASLQRVKALGVRYRENRDVSTSDHALMEKEFKFLRNYIEKIAIRQYRPAERLAIADSNTSFPGISSGVNSSTHKLEKIVDAVFSGRIKLLDQEPISPESLQDVEELSDKSHMVRLKGPTNMNLEKVYSTFTASDLNLELSKGSHTASGTNVSWLDQAISVTRDAILQDTDIAKHLHPALTKERGIYLLL